MCKGLGWPVSSYEPVKLKIKTNSRIYLCSSAVPHFRTFDTNSRPKEVLGMFVRNEVDERHFYFLPPNSEFAYMVLRGEFEIVFEARTFFKIMECAGKKNICAFWEHAVLSDLGELDTFADLMRRSDWAQKKKSFALNLMGQLKKAHQPQSAQINA